MGYIKDVKIGNDTHLIEPTLYAETAGTAAALTAIINNFELSIGAIVTVKITVTNSANATLNIYKNASTSTGAKKIRYNNADIGVGALLENKIYSFVYDGTYWQLIGDLNDNSTCKQIQTAVTDSTTVGETATKFVAKVTQNDNGEITVTKADLPTSSTNTAGIVQLNNGTNSTSTTEAATANSVKTAYDLAVAAIPKNIGTTKGDIIYYNISNNIGNFIRLGTNGNGKFLKTVSGVPSWEEVTKSDVGLSNVENTALSTWTGSTKITTLGTITTGTWQGTAISDTYINSVSASKIDGVLDAAHGGTGLGGINYTFVNNGVLVYDSTALKFKQILINDASNYTNLIADFNNNNKQNQLVNLSVLKMAIPPMNQVNPIYTSDTGYTPSYYAPASKGVLHSVLIAQGISADNSLGNEPLWLDPTTLAGTNDTGHGGALFYGRDTSSAASVKPFKTQWGTLPVEQGGSGATTFTSGNVLVGNGTSAITTIVKTDAATANTLVLRDSNANFSTNLITLNVNTGGIKNNSSTAANQNIITIDSTGISTHYGNLEADNLTATIGTIKMSALNGNITTAQPIMEWYKNTQENNDLITEKIGSLYWAIGNKRASFLSISKNGNDSYNEIFQLPEPTATANVTYNILTTKDIPASGAGAFYSESGRNADLDGSNFSYGTLPLSCGGTGQTTAAGVYQVVRDNGGDDRWVNVSGDTITGQLILSSTTALSSGATSGGPLVIGTKTGSHLAFDYNSIMAKSNTGVADFYLNEFGGNIYMLKASDANYYVTIRSTATSSSTSTGALRVSGGIGITGASYFGSTLTTSGNITVGATSDTAVKKIIVQSVAGDLYLQAGSSATANRTLSVTAHGTGSDKDIIVIDTNNNVNLYGNLTGNVTGNLTGNADTASLLKPIATDTTTASASTWGIPSGSYQVWGERFSDTRLKYTNSNNEQVTITDTGDWTIWLTPATNSNTATLNMKIDGTYYGTFNGDLTGNLHPPVNGGIYWDPYVESSSDSSDAASIYQITSGVAGGTELRISQQNDAADVINMCTNSYIYLNSKKAFTISDTWLRINEDSGFSSGIYTGTSLIRSDAQLQVGDSGAKFYANSSGNGYFSNTLGIAGTNTSYKLYVNGTSYFNGAGTIAGNFTATSGGIFRIDHTGQGAKTKGTAYSAFYLTFKNSANNATYAANPIRYIGTDGTDTYNTCVVLGSDNGTTWVGAGESSSYLPNQIAYNDENLYLSADGSICFYTSGANDGSSYTYAGYFSGGNFSVPNGSIYAGTDGNTTAERQIRVYSGAGSIYMYSQASTTGSRGIYLPAHGSGSAKSVFDVNTNNNVTFYGTLSGNATTASRANITTTATKLAYYSDTNGTFACASHLHALDNLQLSNSRNGTTVDIRANGLIIWGQTYGNTAAEMLSNTAGVFKFGDGGPQIVFNTSATWNAQAGALIFTDHDNAATGASFHFVTTESSDNTGGNLTVTAPRFRARKALAVGSNSDNTSYTLHVTGSTYSTTSIGAGTSISAGTTITSGTYMLANTYVQAKDTMYIDTGNLQMKYNNTWYSIIVNYNNGNTGINAAGGGVYVAYSNSTLVNLLNGKYQFANTTMAQDAANLSGTTVAGRMSFYTNGISIPNPGTVNDGGILRVRGTGESDTILELGTWDDSGAGETIQFNYYPTTSRVTPTYSVTVPKASGTIALTSSSITGNAATATCATRTGVSVGWHKGRDAVVAKTTTISGYSPTISVKTTNGSWEIGSYNHSDYTDKLIFSYVTDTNYNNNTNSHVDFTLTTGGSFSGNAANVTGTVQVGHGGTGATDATNARKNLGASATDQGNSGIWPVTLGGTGACTKGQAIYNLGFRCKYLNNVKTNGSGNLNLSVNPSNWVVLSVYDSYGDGTYICTPYVYYNSSGTGYWYCHITNSSGTAITNTTIITLTVAYCSSLIDIVG